MLYANCDNVGYCFPYDTEKDPVKKHLILARVYLLVK